MEGQQLLGARPTQQPMREQRLIERQEILGRRVQRPGAEVQMRKKTASAVISCVSVSPAGRTITSSKTA